MSESQNTQNTNQLNIQFMCAFVGTVVFLGTVAYGLYLVRQYLPYIGYAALGVAAIVLTIMGLVPIVWFLKYVRDVQWHDIGQDGTVMRGLLGTTVYAPMQTNTPRISRYKNKVAITPVIPSIMEDIESGVIAIGQLAMHMGFELTKGGLMPVIDKFPGTFCIAGQGRSGKTRRVLTIIFQAILGQAKIFIIDPHWSKRDGLAALLAPLAPWLTITNSDDYMQIVRTFVNEMKKRKKIKKAPNDAYWTPWLIIFDEWSYLMTTDDISEDDKALLIECVRDCSTQYAGYMGFSGIIGQVWTEDASGGTVIRRSMHKTFVHLLSAEYAKFFFPRGKYAIQASELEPRQCIYQQGPDVKRIITHDVPDNACEVFAAWLNEHLPPENMLPGTEPLNLPKHVVRQPLTLLQAPTNFTEEVIKPPFERNTDELDIPENIVKQPLVCVDDSELSSVSLQIIGDGFTAKPVKPAYTPDDEQAVLQTVIAMANAGVKLTRGSIRERLKWSSSAKYEVLKAICDKHGIAI